MKSTQHVTIERNGMASGLRNIAALCIALGLSVGLAPAAAEPWIVVTLPAPANAPPNAQPSTKPDTKPDAKPETQSQAKPAAAPQAPITGLLVLSAEQRAKLTLDAKPAQDRDAKSVSPRLTQVGGQEPEIPSTDAAARAMRRWIGPDDQPLVLIELPSPAPSPAPAQPLTLQGEPLAIYTLDATKVARGQEILQSAAKAAQAALKQASGGQNPLATASWRSQRKVLLNRPDAAWRVLMLEGSTISAASDGASLASKLLHAWWCEVLGAASVSSPKVAQDAAASLLASAVIASDAPWMIGVSAAPRASDASQLVPLWPQQSAASIGQLISLTQPARGLNIAQRWTPARQADLLIRLEAMLAASKVHHLWIIDEGGSIDPQTRTSRGLLGVMTPLATMQSSLRLASETTSLAAMRVDQASFATSDYPADAQATTAKIDAIVSGPSVVAGDASSGLIAVIKPMEIKPPGLLIDRWISEWSHQRFTSQSLAAPSIAGATMLIQMQQSTGTVGQPPSVMIYIEWPASITQARLHIGAIEQQRFITITSPTGPTGPAGPAEPQASRSRGLSEQTARVRAVRKDTGSAATIELSPELIEPEGVIRLAVELTASTGERWSWPRAMLPWQQTPGRMPLSTSQWDVFPQQP